MPVISKQSYPVTGDPNFKKIVSCDSRGVFSINLPSIWFDIVGKKSVTGKDLAEAARKFSEAESNVRNSTASTRKIILYQVDREPSFSKGISLSVAAIVALETSVTLNGQTVRSYQDTPHDLPFALTREADGAFHGSARAYKKIEWTREREDFFIKLATAMLQIKASLAELGDETTLALIADQLRPFGSGILSLPSAS